MGKDFHNELGQYVKSKDNENATRVVLNELAKALVNDRENFIEVLRSAGVSVFDSATDIQLVDAFVKNAPSNKKLLLGASYLVNHRNQTLNFDGEQEVSDAGVKDSYKAMDEYFNAGGWGDAIKGIVDTGGQITGKVMNRNKGASIGLEKQQDARKEMAQSIIAQRQKQIEEKEKEKGKTKRTLLIVGGVAVALLIGIGIFIAVKKKK